MSDISIRHAVEADSHNLLSLMKKLAIFEDYIDDFKVTEKDLIQQGFQEHPSYTAIVAEANHQLVAYLVYYLIPFTYNLKPTLYIKELYSDKAYRGQHVGTRLMKAAMFDAKKHGCGRMKWEVLAENQPAQKFYENLKANHDERWQGYVLLESDFV